jgi:hypothetical protein
MILSNTVIHIIGGGVLSSIGWYFGYYAGKKIEKVKNDCENLLRSLRESDRRMRSFPHECRWHCDICKEEKIDALIGVLSYETANDYCIMNVKYCKDNPMCVERAKQLSMWYGEPVTLRKDK